MTGAGDDVTAEWWTSLLNMQPKRFMQAIPAHRPGEGQIGDCYRAAVASLVGWGGDLLSVPHFTEERLLLDDDGPWADFVRARKWCRLLDYDLINLHRDTAVEHGVPYIARVRSKTGPWAHSVLARGDDIIHDPSGVKGGYTIADLATDDDSVEVLCLPYDPDPDEMVRRWIADDETALASRGGGRPDSAPTSTSQPRPTVSSTTDALPSEPLGPEVPVPYGT